MNEIRTIIIDGIEIQTSLSAVEIAGLEQENQELKQKYLNAVADHNYSEDIFEEK